MIAIDLGKQQALNADPKAIQWSHLKGNLERAENTKIISFYWRIKKKLSWISHKELKV